MELSLVKEKIIDPLLRKVSIEGVKYANNRSKEKLNKKAMMKQDEESDIKIRTSSWKFWIDLHAIMNFSETCEQTENILVEQAQEWWSSTGPAKAVWICRYDVRGKKV